MKPSSIVCFPARGRNRDLANSTYSKLVRQFAPLAVELTRYPSWRRVRRYRSQESRGAAGLHPVMHDGATGDIGLKRRIAPVYAFRFSIDTIKAAYGTAERAFDAGDYMLAAQMAPPESELRGCALILSGLVDRGRALLDRIAARTGRANLCRALAAWILDDDAGARTALADARADPAWAGRARRFSALLDRDEIRVWLTAAMLPVRTTPSSSMLQPSQRYGRIKASYVASQMAQNAYDYRPTKSFDRFIDEVPASERPDFIMALSPQWIVPRDFHRVAVPRILWSHDEDVFLYRNVENFRLYDAAICQCSQAHFEMTRGAGVFATSSIMFHPMATPCPIAKAGAEKDIDVLFTGSPFDPFHAEKPRFMYQLSALSNDYRICVIDGYLSQQEYFHLLSRTKFLPLVNRTAGAASPRWRDALTNGACVLFPDGTFYDEIAPGCFPVRTESLIEDIRRHLIAYNGGDAAYDVTRIVAEVNARLRPYQVSQEKLFEYFFKFAAFLATVWCSPRVELGPSSRRLVWLTPMIDGPIYGSDNVASKVDEIAESIDRNDLKDERAYNNAAHFHAAMVLTLPAKRAPHWTEGADRLFARGIELYPRSLLLRFNEAVWYFFSSPRKGQVSAGKFAEIIADFGSLDFETPGADVGFAYCLGARDPVFPYYEYADLTTRDLVLGEGRKDGRAREAIRAACHGYLGYLAHRNADLDGATAEFERALAIFPDNLPLSRLYLDCLLRLYESSPARRPGLTSKVRGAFFAVANRDPAILFSHVQWVIAVLAAANQPTTAREVLAAWYRFAGIVKETTGAAYRRGTARQARALYHFRRFFPRQLADRIDRARLGALPSNDLCRIERMLLSVAKVADRQSTVLFHRRPALGFFPSYVAADFRHDRLAVRLILRALVIWLRVPIDVKALYARKALQGWRAGNVFATALRVQAWSTDSVWSKHFG